MYSPRNHRRHHYLHLHLIPLLLFSLLSLSTPQHLPTAYPEDRLPPLPSIRKSGRHDLIYCQSWRFSIETNDAGKWFSAPSRCIQFVTQYMTGQGYSSDSEMVAGNSLEFAHSVQIAADGKDAWIFDIDDTLLSNLPYYQARGFGLVEVVQHIVVRRAHCGTLRGISVSPRNISPRNDMMPGKFFIPTLIGRVLADDIYMGSRCVATRNQDMRVGLVNRFITFRTQPISIRTPLTCRSTSWICRLCYGRSSTHGNLVEWGEVVGIIAGQSVGEHGTQLTLRTFHTGGVLSGGIAEYVRQYEPLLMEKSNSMRIWFIPHVYVMDTPPFYVI
ncbi:hypothetical protein Cgig2_024050 [Carnegiea gigantea]|uniref:DNA-directed RNA polymerase n=1 Tax=Carnegiea gigantea TaxID=171969 RepID=A0A9Q1KKI5_9CARY|nr:hypothetical protein Cgig2_024050 [Carnegiea gigantea]